MYTAICQYCGSEFSTRNANQKYCSRECTNKGRIVYKTCEICGEQFRPNHKEQKFCSMECCHISQKKELNECPICGQKFRAWNNKQVYCSNECKGIAQRTIERKHCKICGEIFTPKGEWQLCCCREHAAQYRFETKGYMWNCQSPNYINSVNVISTVNLRYKDMLEGMGYSVSLEYNLGKYVYDLKIGNILIEINPYSYHNSTRAPGKAEVKCRKYHYDKYNFATDLGYKCIMVRDWTSDEELIKMIEDKAFHYIGEERLNWFNVKTKEHIMDKGFNYQDMINEGFVEIYDCGKPCFTTDKIKDGIR